VAQETFCKAYRPLLSYQFRRSPSIYPWLHQIASNLPTTLFDIGGTSCIDGSVLVDGPGIVTIGSSGSGCGGGANLKFNPRAFDAVKSLGSAGIVQNTWRELTRR
jgi:hypothetical protein